MMDVALIHKLLLVTAVLLALAAVAAVAGLRVQRRQKCVLARIGVVTSAYARVAAPNEALRSARIPLATRPLLHQVGRLFGYDASRAEHYPVKWWVVLPVSAVAARLMAQVAIPLIGWIALALVPVAALLICRAFYKYCTNRRRNALYMQFPDALAMVVRGVRVGVPVAETMRVIARESAAPTAGEFRLVADRVALGSPLDTALYEMAERNDLAEYRFFATSIGLQSQTGGALGETLDNLADVIRKRVALRARGMALASEARASIVILCSLPVVAGLAISVLNPEYIAGLFDNEAGQKVFASAILSFSIGLAVMRHIVKKSLS